MCRLKKVAEVAKKYNGDDMNSVISRYEVKYCISFDTYHKLMNSINEYLVRDKYYYETIYNLYFDNDYFELINNSIDKPIYKEKIRLRSYSKVNNDTKVFLEIKKKYNNNSNKRRVVISYNDYLNYIKSGIIPKCDKQIISEIDYCFKKYSLKPMIKIVYDRYAYKLKIDDEFRITFDTNIRYNLDELDFNSDNDIMFMNDGYIMEIKTYNGIPIWLKDVLDSLNIYPMSYSKVGEILKECVVDV